MQNETIYCKNRKEWREWLQINSLSKKGIWLIYYKKHTKKHSVYYDEAVEEAICFGWIDGRIKKIDDERYMQYYSPRKSKSRWSVINVGRAKMMIAQGRMTENGLKIFQNGMESKDRIPSSKSFSIPSYLKTALNKNKKAWSNFQRFAPSAKLAYVYWVTNAKTSDTRQKRIEKTIKLIEQNKKFGEK
ncbi:YdeI/OmpD-associated family protein [Candidatus Desantisbacteria bacterium]|nr:YdeI/OmpD-associated family protein [Candidatus Desantisbacteria bacterium]